MPKVKGEEKQMELLRKWEDSINYSLGDLEKRETQMEWMMRILKHYHIIN